MSAPTIDDPRVPAAIDLIHRTGAESFSLRYQDDETPTVWVAVAAYSGGRYEVDAAIVPAGAVLRLAERLLDGGTCVHCRRPSGLVVDVEPELMPAEAFICWTQWDPELGVFRRGCAGDDK